MARLVLFLLQLTAGLSALIAGTFLAGEPETGGPLEFSKEWLDGSPFHDYFIPGLCLGLLGLLLLGAAYAQVARLPYAPHITLLSGVLLDLWILVQMTIVPFSLLQPATLALGTLIAALAIHQLMREPRTSVESPKVHTAG